MSRFRRLARFIRQTGPRALLGLLWVAAALAFLLWTKTLVPLGEDFTLAAQSSCGPDAVRSREIFDLPSAHSFHLAYGEAPILAGRVPTAYPVRFAISSETDESRQETATAQDDCYRHELSGLEPGSYRIVANAGWAARKQLWLIYRAQPPAAALTPLLQRSLHIRLATAAAELSYVILPREGVTLSQWRADPTMGQFMSDRLPATVLLYWSFYPDSQDTAASGCDTQSGCFTGREFSSLRISEATFEESSQRVEITATLDGADDLLPLLQVSPDPQNPISIEVEAGTLRLQDVDPTPDVKSGSTWVWREGPVRFETAESFQTEDRPGAVGLAQIRMWLDAGGQRSADLVLLLFPIVPFVWWGALSRKNQGPFASVWPWRLGGLFWITSLVLFALFPAIGSSAEADWLAMGGAALTVAAYSLTVSTARLSHRRWLALSLVIAAPAVSAFTLAATLALRRSLAVALLTSILLLAACRLGANAYWPDLKANRGRWLLLWLALLPMAVPVQVLGLGYLEGLGWPARLWAQSVILISLYVLPYVVLLAALRVLREQSAQLPHDPARLIALGRLVFALYMVGALRGFSPGLTAPPPIYPLAFVIALLVFTQLLSGRAERLLAIDAERADIYPRQGEFIQRALDLQWARKALNKLMQSESPDPQGYKDKKAELLQYIQELQSGRVSPARDLTGKAPKPRRAAADDPPAARVFNFGPHFDPWGNGVLGASRAAILAVWLLLVYLPIIAARAEQQQVIPFILFTAVFVDVLPLLLKWVLLGFFLGYFFPYLRGANGLQKGLALAAAIAICTVPHDLLNGASLDSLGAMGLDFAQNALLLTLLGLWAFDYQVLRKHGHNFSRLLIAHNLTFLAGYGTSVVLAIGSALTGLISGRIGPLLEALLNLMTPGGQPPS